MSTRAEALARRIEEGAASLAAFAQGLSDEHWETVVPPDGRTVGVIVHHVASMYAIEVQLAQELAAGRAIEGVTWDAVADINAKHARSTKRSPATRRWTRCPARAVPQRTRFGGWPTNSSTGRRRCR